MIILEEFETIRHLLSYNCSIARYGDGELKICLGGSAIAQPGSPALQGRLKQILKNTDPGLLVGIPRMHDGLEVQKKKFWTKYSQPRFTDLYIQKGVYGSAFITRPDSAFHIDCAEYYELVKLLWKNKRVLLYQGVNRRFLKAEPNLFSTAESYTVLYGPSYDAFSEYKTIFQILKNESDRDTVIVLSLGPTATVLANDLTIIGRQTLDLGHMGMFYAHIHPKARQYDGAPYPKDGK